MKLIEYIKGIRRGKDAHRLEKEAMRDPFLSDALDGYHRVEGNHWEAIERLQLHIKKRTSRRIHYIRTIGIAASFLLIIGIGSYVFLSPTSVSEKQNLVAAQQEAMPSTETSLSVDENLIAAREKQEETPEKETIQFTPPVVTQQENASDLSISISDMAVEITSEAEATSTSTLEEITEINSINIADLSDAKVALTQEETSQSKELSADCRESIVLVHEKPTAEQLAIFREYVNANKQLPEDTCAGVKGTVVLKMEVDAAGRPYNIRVAKSLCPSIDQEVIRLLKEGPDWKGTQAVVLEVEW